MQKECRKKWPFSTRHFEKKCLNLMGVSAGDIIKKRRMKRALGISLSTEFVSFTDVAHTAGFYDQAHFIKDFKYYFDKSPKAFFKDENPYLRSFL
ncbi:MAG: helix-turn-helix domain-containing protein [Chitinophagaceae bacterium]